MEKGPKTKGPGASFGSGFAPSTAGGGLALRAGADEGHGFKGIGKVPSAPETDLVGLALIGEGSAELLVTAAEEPIPDCPRDGHKLPFGANSSLPRMDVGELRGAACGEFVQFSAEVQEVDAI